MKQTRTLWDMPITVHVVDSAAQAQDIDAIFDFFKDVDAWFSTFRNDSDVSRLNRGEITLNEANKHVKEIIALGHQTEKETNGYFSIGKVPHLAPLGLVKGWAIEKAKDMLKEKGFENFYIEAGGDISAEGKNEDGVDWRIGIRNPFNPTQIIKSLSIRNQGVATSGTYKRGNHITNPHTGQPIDEIVSLTVIGPTVYDADRFATAAFAMGKQGIEFIESLHGYEAYMIDPAGIATMTSQFETIVL